MFIKIEHASNYSTSTSGHKRKKLANYNFWLTQTRVKIRLGKEIPPILEVILLHETVIKQLHWVSQIMLLYVEKKTKNKRIKKWDKKLTSKNLHPSWYNSITILNININLLLLLLSLLSFYLSSSSSSSSFWLKTFFNTKYKLHLTGWFLHLSLDSSKI